MEGYLESGLRVKEIAKKLNSHIPTIYREIKRGEVKRIKSDLTEYQAYRANTAHGDYEEKVTKRKHSLEIENNQELADYIQKKILKYKYSPDVIIGKLKWERQKFKSITLDNGREFLDWESIERNG